MRKDKWKTRGAHTLHISRDELKNFGSVLRKMTTSSEETTTWRGRIPNRDREPVQLLLTQITPRPGYTVWFCCTMTVAVKLGGHGVVSLRCVLYRPLARLRVSAQSLKTKLKSQRLSQPKGNWGEKCILHFVSLFASLLEVACISETASQLPRVGLHPNVCE